MSKFLIDLAEAHKTHEGWYPGSLSQRNNNPGNLRLTKYQIATYGASQGEGGFAKFPTYDAGFKALMDDIAAKITGKSAHIDYSKNPTLLDYVKVYAPTADGNNPLSYAKSLCEQLSSYRIAPDTPLSELAGFLDDYKVFDEKASIRRLKRMIALENNETRKKRLTERLNSVA